ncbi:MAG: hypothetical protein SFT81_01610 [Candidatus Caenarcaniphilales bacterium]|nr:hypothetical protein [Candidatus Caenarcaniphilales bacterium]
MSINFFGQHRKLLFIGSALALVGTIFFWLRGSVFQEGRKVVGVQLITSKGTLLVGSNRFTHDLAVYHSPYKGWFDGQGRGNFFEIKSKKSKIIKPTWEVTWEWDELYKVGQKEALIQNSPLPEDKEAAIQTLRSLCKNSETESYSCNWNISKRLQIEGITPNYLCIVRSSGEFYGGAHPIAQRSLRTFDWLKKNFVDVDELLPNPLFKETIWEELYRNIREFESHNLTNSLPPNPTANSLPPMQGYESSLLMTGESAEEKVEALLNDRGYSFNQDALCPIIRPDGLYLLFGFPHAEQINRGLNYRAEVNLENLELSNPLKKLYRDYLFSKPEHDVSVYLNSPGLHWQVTQKLNHVEVIHKKKSLELVLPELKDENSEDLLGVFWIYRSPTPTELEKFKFKNIPSPQKGKTLNLAKFLK